MRPSETFYGLRSVNLEDSKCSTCGRSTQRIRINPFRIVRTVVGFAILVCVGFGFVEPVNDVRWVTSMAVGVLLVDLKLFMAFKGSK